MELATADRVADAVYGQLREEICAGDLAPGTRLSVPALAQRLHVSRSPVRDAVLRLVKDRLAQEEPRCGAVVASVDADELVRMYEVREVLEGLVARLAVENAGRRLLDSLRASLREHEHGVDVADPDASTEADVRFHALIRQASDNPEAIRLLEQIQTQVRLAMRSTTVLCGPRQAARDHRRILTAIEAGDPARAERAARAHIARLRNALASHSSTGLPLRTDPASCQQGVAQHR